jgi:DNA-binding PadR family transcriptional regulator
MSTDSIDEFSPTSYALLGLLALQPWTTYELAKQMQRSVRWFWPRAERKIYDEPKRLAQHGLATASTVMNGRRASKVYEITPAGREALRRWLDRPAATAPQLEMESMIHVFFADSGTPAQLIDSIRRIGADARATVEQFATMAEESRDENRFPERWATNCLGMELFVRFNETLAEWATWAEAEASSWPTVRRDRRDVAAGPPERGAALLDAIANRAAR